MLPLWPVPHVRTYAGAGKLTPASRQSSVPIIGKEGYGGGGKRFEEPPLVGDTRHVAEESPPLIASHNVVGAATADTAAAAATVGSAKVRCMCGEAILGVSPLVDGSSQGRSRRRHLRCMLRGRLQLR